MYIYIYTCNYVITSLKLQRYQETLSFFFRPAVSCHIVRVFHGLQWVSQPSSIGPNLQTQGMAYITATSLEMVVNKK